MKYALGPHRVRTQAGRYWIAPDATVIGKAILGRDSSVWFGTVLRGDNDPIELGAETNVQDRCVLHSDPGFPMTIGRGVSVGHGAMLHGCAIADNCLIGIGCIVLNGAEVAENCIIGANSLIPEGKAIPPNSVVLGSPGRVMREVRPEDIAGIRASAAFYVARWRQYEAELRPDP